jgi:hypothetical protein
VAGDESAINVRNHFNFMAAAFPQSRVLAEVQIACAFYYRHAQVDTVKILRLLSEL